jgi:hypothetical protein
MIERLGGAPTELGTTTSEERGAQRMRLLAEGIERLWIQGRAGALAKRLMVVTAAERSTRHGS